jgi:ribosomal protein S18 acetylase RimI-like enzyme
MAETTIELLEQLNPLDLVDLCDATEATMLDTFGFSVGFNQWHPPLRRELESYFKGVMLVPERKLIVGRLDNTIAGSLQLIIPSLSNKTSNFAVSLDNHFVAPWARNLGMAKALLEFSERHALSKGYKLIRLSVNSMREAAITLYESYGYKKWGTLEKYENVANQIVSGYFYYKDLQKEKIENQNETV